MRRAKAPLTIPEMIAQLSEMGICISRSSVRAAIEEWSMNDQLIVHEDRYDMKRKYE